ncbi:MAG: MOSC domain-containing protein, partial [Planctomycetes bacterium]|nr:MOSC domain-containing protein [Planctomycetota bacterium]
MESGSVIHLCLQGPGDSFPNAVDSATAVVGHGFKGNREASEGRQITLIEEEALEQLRNELGVEFSLSDSRRNVVTKGIELNFLVGKEFFLGDAKLRGTALCHPCMDLERKTHPGVMAALK